MAGIRKEGEKTDLNLPPFPPEVIARYPFSVLESGMRQAHLLNAQAFNPYQNAQITLRTVRIADLVPCARYVLQSGLETQRELRRWLLSQYIDTLNLNQSQAALRIQWGQRQEVLTPPIIEVSVEDGGAKLVTDGLHRVIMARSLGIETINVVLIEGAAFPLGVMPVSWDEVEVVDAVPPLSKKRRLRYLSPLDALSRGLGMNSDFAQRVLGGVADSSFAYTFFYRDLDFSTIQGVAAELSRGEESRRRYSRAGTLITRKGEFGPEVLLVPSDKVAQSWSIPIRSRIDEEHAPEITALRALRELGVTLDSSQGMGEPLIFIDNSRPNQPRVEFVFLHDVNEQEVNIPSGAMWVNRGELFAMMDEFSIDVRFDSMMTALALKRWMELPDHLGVRVEKPIEEHPVLGPTMEHLRRVQT